MENKSGGAMSEHRNEVNSLGWTKMENRANSLGRRSIKYDTQNTANFKKYLKLMSYPILLISLKREPLLHNDSKIRRLNGCEKQEDPREEAKMNKTSLLHTN